MVAINKSSFAQSGEKYATGGNILSATHRLGSNNYADLNIFTNSQKRAIFTKDGLFDVLGQSRFRKNSIFDSLITAFSINTQSLKAGTINVTANGQVGGIFTVGNSLTFNGTTNSITSGSGAISFLNNNLTTTVQNLKTCASLIF